MHLIRDTTPRTDLIVYIYIYLNICLSDDFQKFSRIRCHLEQPVKTPRNPEWLLTIDIDGSCPWIGLVKKNAGHRRDVPCHHQTGVVIVVGCHIKVAFKAHQWTLIWTSYPWHLNHLQWQNLIFSAKTCYSCWLHDWRNTCARLKKKGIEPRNSWLVRVGV